MIAIQQTCCDGTVDVLSCVEMPDSDLGDQDVRVRILYSPINPADVNMLEGKYVVKPSLPYVPGNECVGVVESVGVDVEGFKANDLVIFPFQGRHHWVGFWREVCTVPSQMCLLIPRGWDPQQAAMLAVNPITAWLMLTTIVALQPGDWIIQNLATSGVGRWVIVLAKRLGYKTVNCVRRKNAVEDLHLLGADDVVIETEDFSSAVDRKGDCQLALNGVGGDSATQIAKCLASGGTMVTYGAMAKAPLRFGNGMFIFKQNSVTGFNRTLWCDNASELDVRQAYSDLFSVVNPDEVKIPIEAVYELRDYKKAINHVMRSDRRGKILFKNS